VVAGQVVPTVIAGITLPLAARGEWVPNPPLLARAHGPIIALLVVARVTYGAVTARVRVTQVLACELATLIEWMTSPAFGTGTDGAVILDPTIGILPTGVCLPTRVDATELVAGLKVTTVLVRSAFRLTSDHRVTLVELRAGASGYAIFYVTQGAISTGSSGAGIVAPVVRTGHPSATVTVVDTLRPTATVQRVSDVVLWTGAHSLVALQVHAAVSTARTGVRLTEGAVTGSEWIAGAPSRTRADRLSVPHFAVCPNPTYAGDSARVDALAVLARLAIRAMFVLCTLRVNTASKRIALVAWQTGTDGLVLTGDAVGVCSTLIETARIHGLLLHWFSWAAANVGISLITRRT